MKIELKTNHEPKLSLKKVKSKTKTKNNKRIKNRNKLIFLTNNFFIAGQNYHSDCTYDEMEP